MSPKWLGATTCAAALLACCLLPARAAVGPYVTGGVNGQVSFLTPPLNQSFSQFDLNASLSVEQDNSGLKWQFSWQDGGAGINVSVTPKSIIKSYSGLLNGQRVTSTTEGLVHLNGDGAHNYYAQVVVTKGIVWGAQYPDAIRLVLWQRNAADTGWQQPPIYSRYGWCGTCSFGTWTTTGGPFAISQ